jgi:hypothetical protein
MTRIPQSPPEDLDSKPKPPLAPPRKIDSSHRINIVIKNKNETEQISKMKIITDTFKQKVAELHKQAQEHKEIEVRTQDKYPPQTLKEKLGYLIEECAEVLQAAGKTLRFGLENFNPELPVQQRIKNKDWLLEEIKDLRYAMYLVEEDLKK